MSEEKFSKQNLSVRLDSSDIDDINYLIEQTGVAYVPTMSQKELLRVILSSAVNKTKPKQVSMPDDLAKIQELEEVVNLQTQNIEEKDKAIESLRKQVKAAVDDLDSKNEKLEEIETTGKQFYDEAQKLVGENNQLKQMVEELKQFADTSKQQINSMLKLEPTDLLLKGLALSDKAIILRYCEQVAKRKQADFTPKDLLIDTIFMPWIKGNAFDFRDKLGLRIPISEIKKVEDYYAKQEAGNE